ncbi:MAG: 3-oxoacyl-ACP reductase [Alphaproteobacteria bacterium 64-11]|nr:SDR family NAD(P)-dependent oxidoreductase [Alphaproteobacteria bacterium]OJU08627.1 MAG: 3-oxoacyl-ACP reductase [Alphaproteobacteria bacterium 64-11]
MAISFAGKVAIITGAGGGLGRAHALHLAKLGARVVVNDLGGSLDGTGGNSEASEKVVAEIKAAGGEAIANGASVSDDAGVAHLVKQTMDAFGRIDVLVANAGILRDKSFGKMEIKDFEAVVNVHLMGTVKPARAVWDIMKGQGYGRIVVTTSSTGLYGNFGQTNYGAAKMSLVGFMNSLKLEGAKDNIKVNAICPVAATRMTENLMPPAISEMLKPEFVSPAVAWLASEEAPTGMIMTAAAGVFAAARMVETDGINLGHGASADDIAAHFAQIADWSTAKHYDQGGEQSAKFFARVQEKPLLS